MTVQQALQKLSEAEAALAAAREEHAAVVDRAAAGDRKANPMQSRAALEVSERAAVLARQGVLRAEAEAATQRVAHLEDELAAATAAVPEVEAQVHEAAKVIEDAQQRLASARASVKTLEGELIQARAAAEPRPRIRVVSGTLAEVEQQIDASTVDRSKAAELLARWRKGMTMKSNVHSTPEQLSKLYDVTRVALAYDTMTGAILDSAAMEIAWGNVFGGAFDVADSRDWAPGVPEARLAAKLVEVA